MHNECSFLKRLTNLWVGNSWVVEDAKIAGFLFCFVFGLVALDLYVDLSECVAEVHRLPNTSKLLFWGICRWYFMARRPPACKIHLSIIVEGFMSCRALFFSHKISQRTLILLLSTYKVLCETLILAWGTKHKTYVLEEMNKNSEKCYRCHLWEEIQGKYLIKFINDTFQRVKDYLILKGWWSVCASISFKVRHKEIDSIFQEGFRYKANALNLRDLKNCIRLLWNLSR